MESVKLNATALAQVYGKDFLIDGAAPSVSPASSSQRRVVVVTAYPHTVPAAAAQFLQSILSACKLLPGQVEIVTASPDIPDYTSIHLQWNNSITLLFGVQPDQIGLPMHFPHFQVQSFAEKTYLSSPPLEEVEQDRSLKLQLWQSLQKLFAV